MPQDTRYNTQQIRNLRRKFEQSKQRKRLTK